MGGEIGSGCFGKVFKGFLDDEVHDSGHVQIIRHPVAIKAVKGELMATLNVIA